MPVSSKHCCGGFARQDAQEALSAGMSCLQGLSLLATSTIPLARTRPKYVMHLPRKKTLRQERLVTHENSKRMFPGSATSELCLSSIAVHDTAPTPPVFVAALAPRREMLIEYVEELADGPAVESCSRRRRDDARLPQPRARCPAGIGQLLFRGNGSESLEMTHQRIPGGSPAFRHNPIELSRDIVAKRRIHRRFDRPVSPHTVCRRIRRKLAL